MKTLESYLREHSNKGIVDFRIRANGNKFYIHPLGKDGETLDFVVIGNGLKPKNGTIQQIEVNRTGRVIAGPNDGVVGNVVAVDWLKKIVKIENSEGDIITVPWGYVEQFTG